MDDGAGHNQRLRGTQMGIAVKVRDTDHIYSPWPHTETTLYIYANKMMGNGFTIVTWAE